MEPDQISNKLLSYLREELNDSAIEYSVPVTQLQGGFETATYRFHLKGVPQELNSKRSIGLLGSTMTDRSFWLRVLSRAFRRIRAGWTFRR